MLLLPLQWRQWWWAGASVRHQRPEWVGVRLRALLREEPVTHVIGQHVTGETTSWISRIFRPLQVWFDQKKKRSHNIPLSIVQVIGQHLKWNSWASGDSAKANFRLFPDGYGLSRWGILIDVEGGGYGGRKAGWKYIYLQLRLSWHTPLALTCLHFLPLYKNRYKISRKCSAILHWSPEPLFIPAKLKSIRITRKKKDTSTYSRELLWRVKYNVILKYCYFTFLHKFFSSTSLKTSLTYKKNTKSVSKAKCYILEIMMPLLI